MRTIALILVLAWLSTSNMCGLLTPAALEARSAHHSSRGNLNPTVISSSATAPAGVDFDSQVKPILQSRCQPCHFPGGVMYQRLPFDRAQTINTLGEKMFTRIKDEREQKIIRAFLASGESNN